MRKKSETSIEKDWPNLGFFKVLFFFFFKIFQLPGGGDILISEQNNMIAFFDMVFDYQPNGTCSMVTICRVLTTIPQI